MAKPNPGNNQEKTKSARERSNANLRPQKKGEPSHNPFGRPTKKESLTSLLKEVGEWAYPRDKNKLTFKEKLAVATYMKAIRGGSVAFMEAWNRLEGKVTQPLDFELKSDRFLKNLDKILGTPVAGEAKYLKTTDLIAALEKRGIKVAPAAQPHDRK